MTPMRLLSSLFALSLIAASCGDDSRDTLVADAPAGSEDVADGMDTAPDPADTSADSISGDVSAGAGFVDAGRSLDAPVAGIVVDGDGSDWADVDGLDMTLFPIADESSEPKDSTVKVAHDDDYVYMLFQIDDDYNYDVADPHLSASAAIQWAVDSGAGEAMGSTDEDRDTSLGLVDIWHWELECGAGEENGGAVAGPGDGHDPGNDSACNFDDEYATATEDREDDNTSSGENSLLGVWTHTASSADEAGTWTFEIRRPLDTGDSQDAQFAAGSSSLMAVSYWDADSGPDGWEDDLHIVSANQGWITVNFI